MNPLTNTKNQNILNERELRLGYTGTHSSWHGRYKDSAWIFIGGLNYELTEGDVICVFSQYGEVVNLNLVRDRKTGQSKGFAFLCYEDQRSTVLATDNLNGIKLAGRVIRVDHVEQYKVPKDGTMDVGLSKKSKKNVTVPEGSDMVSAFVREHGCGPEVMKQLEKIQKQQKEALKKKAESQAISHSSDNLHSHPRLPVRSQYKRNSPDDREPHTERRRDDTKPSPYLGTSTSPRSRKSSPPQRRRREPSSPYHLRIDSKSSNYHEPKPRLSPCRRRDEDPSPPRQKPGCDSSRHCSNQSPPHRRLHSRLSPDRRIREFDRSPLRGRPTRDARSPPRNYSNHSPPRRRTDSSPSCWQSDSKQSSQRRHYLDPFSPHRRSDFDSPPTRRRSRSTSHPRRKNDANPSPPRHLRKNIHSSTSSTRSLNSPSRIKQESPSHGYTCPSSHQMNGSSPHHSKLRSDSRR